MTESRASTTIRRAEQDIRGLIAEAATSGEYDLVSRLSGIARRLADLADQAAGSASSVGEMPVSSPADVEARVGKRAVPAASRKSSRKVGYPRFEKSRGMLVKVGWSKKDRSEYVHRAPKAGVDAVALRVMGLGAEGRMFTTEELLPVKLGSGGDDLPGYQAYICLAWLRDIGAVEQHGREGYSVLGEDVIGAVNAAWESLAASRR